MSHIDLKFHCYDCGGIWTINEVDTFNTPSGIKYVCKECRGRCISSTELGKSKNVKSLKQRFSYKSVYIIIFALLFFIVSIYMYDRKTVQDDYKNYLSNTNSIRYSINLRIKNFQDDLKKLDEYTKKGIKNKDYSQTLYRVTSAKNYIYSMRYEVEKIKKPETTRVLELYEKETRFWKEPNYKNYIVYMGTFNNLRNKYSWDYLEVIKDKIYFEAIKEKLKEQIRKSSVSKFRNTLSIRHN